MKTERIFIESAQDVEQIGRVGRLLREGAVVAFPTETVYGLGAKAERSVLARLDTVKKRQAAKHYSLHIGSLDDLPRYVPRPGFQARKLMRNVWPGPVTIVFEQDQQSLNKVQSGLPAETYEILYPNGMVGVRFPDHPIACALLTAAVAPIVAPSANPASFAPAVHADEVGAYFDGQIDLIADAPGACRYGLNSTVVRVGSRGVEVLREGVYRREQMVAAGTVRILFVCTGNTCRSPMAEALCRKYFAEKFKCGLDEVAGFGYSIESAGVAAFEAMPASSHASAVGREHGTPLDNHRSRGLTEAMIRESDLIFVMNQSHFWAVTQAVAEAETKCYMLDASGAIADPAGYGPEVYRACAEQIERSLQERMNELL